MWGFYILTELPIWKTANNIIKRQHLFLCKFWLVFISSLFVFPSDSQREFAPRPGSAYVTDEIWRKAGKKKTH